MPRYLPERGAIAGIDTEVFDAFWVELLARGCLYNLRAILGVDDALLLAPRIHRGNFVESIAQAIGSDFTSVDRITSFLTVNMERCSDPSLTPLVELEDDVVPMSMSIMLTSPHRNFLAILQRDPNLVGEAGRLMGVVGEDQAAQVLDRLKAGVLLARRAKVTRPDGSPAGDIDVLACDPANHLVVALEVRWGLAADGNEEVHRVEAAAIDKRKQVVRLRKELLRGARVSIPPDWPDLATYQWRWYLLTRDVLPMREIATDDIVIRSVQLLQYMLKPESDLLTTCALLDNPPWPPKELQDTHWDSFRYGDVRVDVELINA
jgi:hypothetical protein